MLTNVPQMSKCSWPGLIDAFEYTERVESSRPIPVCLLTRGDDPLVSCITDNYSHM